VEARSFPSANATLDPFRLISYFPPMAILELVKAPDPRLKLASAPVGDIDSKLCRFMDDMLETMFDAKGIGLAAIQVGVPKRVAVIDLDPRGPKSSPLYLVNPRIVEASEEQTTTNEGCLSVPDIWEDVKRPARLTVAYTDEKGRQQTVKAEGLLAICLQHEIDHINGLIFLDHVSRLKRSIALRKAAKQKRKE
jgi:peptide deformylase